jgi:hypothetical protein
MDVKLRNGEQALEDYLTPSVGAYETNGGRLEDAQALAEKNAKAIGAALACLVEHKLMTFEDAQAAVGNWDGELLP